MKKKENFQHFITAERSTIPIYPQIDTSPAFNLVDRVTNNPFQERMRKPRDTQDVPPPLPQINKIIPRPAINPWTEQPRSTAGGSKRIVRPPLPPHALLHAFEALSNYVSRRIN